MKKRMALLVYIDLDPVEGTFSTTNSVLNSIAGMLDDRIGHYNPIVSIAPLSQQPSNFPHDSSTSQEIPVAGRPPEPLQMYVKREEGGYDVVTTGEIVLSLGNEPVLDIPLELAGKLPTIPPLPIDDVLLYNEGYFPA